MVPRLAFGPLLASAELRFCFLAQNDPKLLGEEWKNIQEVQLFVTSSLVALFEVSGEG